jgi:hypothetical protein
MKLHSSLMLIFLVAAFNAHATTPDLKTAAQFGVLASAAVTNVDAGTTIVGSVGNAPGVPPGTYAISGLTAVMVTGGTLEPSVNAATQQAQIDATGAYLTAANTSLNP